jgi:sulfur-oxidizing protein SoxZ
MSKPRVKVPKSASAGEEVTIKALVSHKMESGQRKDADGNKIPQMIIHSFAATFDGQEVMSLNLSAAISTNPYIKFKFKVPKTGDLAFKWVDDNNKVIETSKTITVT